MRKNKHLASTIAAAMAVAMLAGTSAFAESRHRQETRRGGDARSTVRRERSAQPQERQRSDESRNYRRRESSSTEPQSRRPSTFRPETSESYRRGDSSTRESYRRNDSSTRESYRRNDSSSRESYRRNDSSSRDSYRRNDSSRDSYRRNDSYRGGDRNRSYGSHSSGSYGNRQHFSHRGPVTRYSRYGNGYRVWIGGAPYPFFVPLSYWHPSRFRVGLVINLGGYYNPGGYYDYYDGYDGYDYRAQSRGDLRGVVESVDYRRDTFVVRNDASGSFVTVIARDREGRNVRPGDYVELTGTWTRNGLFSAYDVDLLDSGYRDRY